LRDPAPDAPFANFPNFLYHFAKTWPEVLPEMKSTIFPILTIPLAISLASTALCASISYDGQSFLLDGRRTFIFSGEFHYWRIPAAEWSERIQRIKAAGINAISTPIPWAWHEKKPGQIDLSDFEDFLRTCQQHRLFVIARIGPLTGADLEFEGVPYWLIALEVPGVDTDSDLYLRYAARWYNAVCPLVARYQITKRGPIILVQIDNEHENTLGRPSSADPAHLRTLANAARERGIEVPLYINYRLWPPADVPNLLTALDIFPNWNLNALCSALTRHRQKWPDSPLSIAEFACFEDVSTVGKPLPEPPDDLPSAYRANVLTTLASRASFINHYTIAGMWNFPYWRRCDIGSIYYPNAPLTVTGGFNDTYWPLRLTGQWVNSFAPDFLKAQQLPPEIVELISTETGAAPRNAQQVLVHAFLGGDALYVFLQEQQGKPAAFRLRVNNPASGQTSAFPASGWISLSPRQARILTANLVGNVNFSYATSEILARGALGDTEYVVFYGDPGIPGETAIATSQQPTSFSPSIRLTRDGSVLRLNYIHSKDDQFARFGKTLLVITTRDRAARTWHIGSGEKSALLITDADIAKDSMSIAAGIKTTLLCKPGTAHVSAFFAQPPDRVLLDGKKARLSISGDVHSFIIKTASAPSVGLRLRRGKIASEASLPESKAHFVRIAHLSRLARSGFYNPGFIRLRTTVPKNALNSITVETNATPPPILHVNQSPVSGEINKGGAWTFDLRREIGDDQNQLCLTLEFETVPQLKVSTSPEANLEWEASAGLKGEWLLLFARPDGPEWDKTRLPEKPAANDIAWFALPFTLHPKPAWEQPLLLTVEAADEAFIWLNGRRFARYTSRGPEESFPLPSSWLLEGQNLVVIAARGNRPVAAEIASDDAHSLMHHELEVEW
jgi:hypothetical protein